jgi:hypothetical protein
MLRDEGGRIADEESQVHIGVAPPAKGFDFDFDDESAAVAPPPAPSRLDVPAKPAVVVGLAQARKKRGTGGPTRDPQPASTRSQPASAPPPMPRAAPSSSRSQPRSAQLNAQAPPISSTASARAKPASIPPPVPRSPSAKKQLPSPFSEPTRMVDNDELIGSPRAGRSAGGGGGGSLFDEPTRLGDVDADLLMQTRGDDASGAEDYPPKFLPATTELAPMQFDDLPRDDDATRMATRESISRRQPPRSGGGAKPATQDEHTRAVDIRTDPAINDIDWDID